MLLDRAVNGFYLTPLDTSMLAWLAYELKYCVYTDLSWFAILIFSGVDP